MIPKDKSTGFPLNPAQKAAAQAPTSPLLIVAGAGTGKTRTLTSRITYLIESGVPADRICAITFTNKAAGEMKHRVGDPSLEHGGPLIATFHSLGARILRKECRTLGRTPNFTIFDDHDSFDLLKKVVKKALPKTKGGGMGEKLNKKESPAYFSKMISEIKNLDDALTELKETEEKKTLIKKIFAGYEDALLRNNAFDFDDLIEKPVTLFKSNPSILEKYRAKFDAILVDEYQDINPKQYELVKLLAEIHKNLSVVGDDEQTIYSWRYANIRTFLDFEKHWPGAKIYFLEENYRSTANIIHAAGSVAENNKFRTPKQLWTSNAEGERISLFEAWGENDEALWIADEIKKLRAKKSEEEIAILYRTNAQSRAIEQALIRQNIAYEIFGGLRFYDRREVKDAVAALRWTSNKKDELSQERLEKNLTKRKFASFKDKIGTAEDLKPADVLKVFMETFGYFDYLEENFLNSDERQENIVELIAFASGFIDLTDLLEKISLLQATDTLEATNKVNMMTIHLAKGLEFKNVFLAGVAEGLLPHIRSIDNEASVEEERRLMYVAMTRAKEKLHLSFYGMPSRFLAEIPPQYVTLTVETGEGDDTEKDFEENVINFD